MAKKPAPKKAPPPGKGGFYRLMRDLHGYFSAFAFVALMFFSATGILLNHPGLLAGKGKPFEERVITLAPADLAKVKTAKEPGRALAEIVDTQIKLNGAYANGEVSGQDVFVRLQGARGSSDLRGNLETGKTEVTVETAPLTEVFNNLHRGELAGTAWKFWIDVIAAVLLVLSVMGYILFFSLRFRVRTALVLTGLSVVAMFGLYFAFVP